MVWWPCSIFTVTYAIMNIRVIYVCVTVYWTLLRAKHTKPQYVPLSEAFQVILIKAFIMDVVEILNVNACDINYELAEAVAK